jgi:predicted acyltransferase
MSTKPAGERLLSLDAFRGATIAGMILVNNSGDESSTWWPLLHQPWHGWTPTDLVFPFFLFVVGMSLTFSHRLGFRPALVRSLKLVGLGLVVNFTTGGFALPLRWAGVLQRIGLCYLAAWAARRWLGTRGQAVLAVSLLVGYWAVMTRVVGPEGFAPNLEPAANLSAQVDRIFLGGHLYRWTKTWDPEGVLSTFPAIATALLGLLAGEWLRSGRTPAAKAVGFVAGGLVVFALGRLWGEAAPSWLLFPVNKKIWSPSFVLLTGGLAAALFGLTWWVVDVRGVRGWTRPLVTYGQERDRGLRGIGGTVGRLGHDPLGGDDRRRPDPPGAPAPGALRELAPAHARGLRLRPRQRPPVVGGRPVDGEAKPLPEGVKALVIPRDRDWTGPEGSAGIADPSSPDSDGAPRDDRVTGSPSPG